MEEEHATGSATTVHRWLFSGDGGSEPVLVEAVPGARLAEVVVLVLSSELVKLGTGSSPGVGTCESYLPDCSAVSAGTPNASRGGTG